MKDLVDVEKYLTTPRGKRKKNLVSELRIIYHSCPPTLTIKKFDLILLLLLSILNHSMSASFVRYFWFVSETKVCCKKLGLPLCLYSNERYLLFNVPLRMWAECCDTLLAANNDSYHHNKDLFVCLISSCKCLKKHRADNTAVWQQPTRRSVSQRVLLQRAFMWRMCFPWYHLDDRRGGIAACVKPGNLTPPGNRSVLLEKAVESRGWRWFTRYLMPSPIVYWSESLE